MPNKDLMHIPLVLPMYVMYINSWLNGGGGGGGGDMTILFFNAGKEQGCYLAIFTELAWSKKDSI